MTIRLLSIIVLVFVQTSVVLAHGDEPRLEISVERIQPGGVVDVRGVDFEREEIVTLTLVNTQTAIPFGEVMADVDGVFLLNLTIPLDTPNGTYNFLATTDDHNITSPDLSIQDPAILADGQGEEERRDEEEPLLMPVPTYPPGVIPGLAPGATPAGTGKSENSGVNISMVVMGGFVLMLGVMLFVMQRRKNR